MEIGDWGKIVSNDAQFTDFFFGIRGILPIYHMCVIFVTFRYPVITFEITVDFPILEITFLQAMNRIVFMPRLNTGVLFIKILL